jgi:UDP-N-acetylglucosamine acyltransferase
MYKIHPTAVVHADAILGEDVEIGAYAVVEADTVIGAGTVIHPHAIVRSYTRMGEGNVVDSYAVLGGAPQDLSFDPRQETWLQIGNRNTFREGVTISRATKASGATVVGNDTYWMANAHAGHDATVESNAIITNNVMIAGHARIGRGAVLGGGVAVHQFCWVGERTMMQGHSGASMHIPPYCIVAEINNIAGLNRVGLRRAADVTETDAEEVKEAFRLLYRSGLTPQDALAEMDRFVGWGKPADRFRQFVRNALQAEGRYQRGVCGMKRRAAHEKRESPKVAVTVPHKTPAWRG